MSSRGIERECFKTWETFWGTLLKFYAQKRGHDWNNGSITGTTSAGLQLQSMNRKRSWRAPASNCNRSCRAHSDVSTIGEGRRGTIVNVFTEPQWRRRGIAGRLVKEIIAWSKNECLDRLLLHASDDGRSVYERLGFIAGNEMYFAGVS